MQKLTLKAMRINRNLKLKDVANGLHIAMQTISRWEREPERMSVKNLIKLISFYDYDLSDLKVKK